MVEKRNNYPLPIAPHCADAVVNIAYNTRGEPTTVSYRSGGETGTELTVWTIVWHATIPVHFRTIKRSL